MFPWRRFQQTFPVWFRALLFVIVAPGAAAVLIPWHQLRQYRLLPRCLHRKGLLLYKKQYMFQKHRDVSEE